MAEIYEQSLVELRDALRAGQVSVRETVEACLERVESTEPHIGALVHVQGQAAVEQAQAMDRQGPEDDQPLWGVPVIIKDVLTTKGIPTTCGSKMLERFVPFYDAEAVARLKQAGAIVLGKSNMDEFAMGSSTENSAFQQTRNPWDVTRVPGGSSGGSAASTAAGQTPLSLGTDTGGSIRQPAGFCGLVGLKPTYGLVSRYGLVAYGSSLDQAGPLTRSVKDAACALSVIAGHDAKDSTSAPRPAVDYLQGLDRRQDLKGLTMGLPAEYWEGGLDPEVDTTSRTAIELAEQLGARLKPVSLPSSPYAIAAYYIIVMAEASSNLARYDGVRYGFRDEQAGELLDMYVKSRSRGFGKEVQRRIILGTYVLSAGYYDAYYKKAAQVRRLIREEYLQALSECDLIVAPTAPTVAFKLGEKTDDPLQMYLTDIFTNPLNLTGLPGLCLPAGLGGQSGMPVGLQLFGADFAEELLLQAGHVLESALQPLPKPEALCDLGL
jgi:aspartyl-tRNA(Asn)/glutamyl-tRNA(Gln) amidotransferase subunit A